MKSITFLIHLSLLFCSLDLLGQEGVDYDLKKPAKYENRTLGYEKTYTTKFKAPRHFIQNTVTHYNYYFNANNKLIAILNRAKAQNKDDFSQLLPFYNYSLDITARDRRELDSVIEKANMGILIHDLRNDWIDNLYMLMGRAYYYKKLFDSAYITFQFVNYAFAPMDKDGNRTPIGSNSEMEKGNNSLSISTNEKTNVVKKVFNTRPSRNEALIWQIRTYIASGQLSQAAVLTQILLQDPQFPERLMADLHETQALWFYDQHMYDSAAVYLDKALPVAGTDLERARWEYLIAQLYDLSGKPRQSQDYFERVVKHTYDPVMEVYARLNAIRESRGEGNPDEEIRKNIHALEKMAKKEVYGPYRDLIYYSAAEMELERKDTAGAKKFLLLSTRNSSNGSTVKDKAFLQLADLVFAEKKYRLSKQYYDSVSLSGLSSAPNSNVLLDRKKALNQIVAQMDIIERQDSLQRIALMTEQERTAYIKKMVRNARRQQGVSEEDMGNFQNPSFNNTSGPADLFATGGNNAEWYFYNNALKSKGYTDFRSKWGNRPNVDNWMLASQISRQRVQGNRADGAQGVASENVTTTPTVVDFASLLANVPLTPEKMKKSRDSVEKSLFVLGYSLQNGLPDYPYAIKAYDSLLERFPVTTRKEEALFNLYYCYLKTGDSLRASQMLQMLRKQYPDGKFTKMLIHPEQLRSPENIAREDATHQYEDIYNQFIEGKFEEALTAKKRLDSVYGQKYWTPQLQYIEAMYYMHIRMDSVALAEFSNIVKTHAGTPIAAKAKTAYDVLKDRKRMEEYLSKLQIERAKDDSFAVAAPKAGEKVQPTPTPPPVAAAKVPVKKQDSASRLAPLRKADTAQAVKKAPGFVSAYVYAPQRQHMVAVVLVKVDPVYVTETRNAFNRYNQENYYSKPMEINNLSLSDTTKLVVISGFDSASAALDYLAKAQRLAPREIVPWLPAGRYSFIILSDQNLEILKTNKDMGEYRRFLSAYFPGNF